MGLENEKILKAATTTSDLAAGGIMNEKQAAKFLQMVFDSTEVLKQCRTINMPSATYEIDKIGVGSRIMRGMTENEDMSSYTKKPTFGKIELIAKKYALPWEISEDALEDNIEGQTMEDIIAKMFAKQMGLDTEDLAINGDTSDPDTMIDGAIDEVVATITVDSTAGFPRTSESGWLLIETENIGYTGITATTFTGCVRGDNGTVAATHADPNAITWTSNPLTGNDDGWMKKIYDGDGNYTDLSGINSGAIDKAHFFSVYQSLPAKYRRGGNKAALRWFMGSAQKALWDEALTERATAAGDAVLGGADFRPLGIPILEVPAFPNEILMLTYPMNLILGIWRRIKVRKTDQDKESIYKDLRFYNTTTRMDFEVEETEAVGYGDGLDIV